MTLKKRWYDFLTWFTTTVFIAYNMAPFFLLELEASRAFYASMNYIGHIVGRSKSLVTLVVQIV